MRRRALILALLASLPAAPAARAAAAGGPLLPPLPPRHLMTRVGAPVPPARSFRSGFFVDAAGGYKVGVESFGGAVILVVFHGHRGKVVHLSETAYLARGVAAPERLQATFGRFGKVSMHFRESKHRTWAGKRRACHGAHRLLRRRGVFVGRLTFRGEGGYLSVHLHRAKGAVMTVAPKCLRPRKPAVRRLQLAASFFYPAATLFAEERQGVDTTGVLAFEHRGRMALIAMHQESRGKLAIVRIGFARDRGRLRVNEAVTSASISPPAPFHGIGRYRAAADGAVSWTGDLSVNFPGAPRFPLTGPGFKVLLEAPL